MGAIQAPRPLSPPSPSPVPRAPTPPRPHSTHPQADCLRAQGRHYEARGLYRGAAVVFRRCRLAHQASAGLARVAFGRGELLLSCGRAQVCLPLLSLSLLSLSLTHTLSSLSLSHALLRPCAGVPCLAPV